MRVVVKIASAGVRYVDRNSACSSVRQLDDAPVRGSENGGPSHCHDIRRHMNPAAAPWLVICIGELPRLNPFHWHHQRMGAEVYRVRVKHWPHVQTHRRVGPGARHYNRGQLPRTGVAWRAQVHAHRAAHNGGEERGAHARNASDTIAPRAEALELSALKHQLAVVRARVASLPALPSRLPSSRSPPLWFSSGASSRTWDRT